MVLESQRIRGRETVITSGGFGSGVSVPVWFCNRSCF